MKIGGWRTRSVFERYAIVSQSDEAEGVKLRSLLSFAGLASVIDTFDAIAKPESFSLLYLNPPYDSEIGTIANRRMETVFLEHTYRWLRMDGDLILVIPFERLRDCSGILSSHFASLRFFRMADPDSVQYRQIAVFGVRREVRGSAVENNKRQLHSIGLYGSFLELTKLQPGACAPYSVPPSGEATLNYRGLPYDILRGPASALWGMETGGAVTDAARRCCYGAAHHTVVWRPRWPLVYRRTAQWRLRRGRDPLFASPLYNPSKLPVNLM
jgi:hypothetical protein